MAWTRKVSDADIHELESIVSILTDPVDQNKFDVIDKGMMISAKYIWIMHSIPKLGVTEYIGDNAGTVRRFFNETVDFINGKPRPIRVESWDGIIRDIIKQYDVTQKIYGNVGSQSVAIALQRSGLSSSAVGHKDIDLTLLSYAHYEIMLKWIVREDGVYDMLKTILLLTSIYKRYYPNGDGTDPSTAGGSDVSQQ